MSKKIVWLSVTTCVLSLGALGVGGMAWMQAWLNQPLDEPVLGDPVEILDVAGVPANEGDRALDLTALDEGGNTLVIWRCGKDLAGSRYDYAGAWTHLQGRLLVAPASRTLRAGEIHIAVGAMRGHGEHPAPNALINTVRANRWFLLEDHPTAVFRVDAVTPRVDGEADGLDGAVEGWTHWLQGTLRLNGIERSLPVPARVEVEGDSVRLDAVFPISRAAFEVARRQGFEPPADVDDQVVLEVHVHVTPDPLAIVAELNRQLVAQQASTGLLGDAVRNLTARLEQAELALDELRREMARHGSSSTPAIDLTALPKRFTDRVDYQFVSDDGRYRDLGYAPEFEMVLVEGDAAQGVRPFCVQTTEVTWEMFRAWSYSEDVANQTSTVALREADLRPSPCYDDASRGFGFDGRPALGLSRRNAVAFCRFVSERTGRSYRLMTAAEWQYLATAAGGLPEDLHEVAWLRGNAETDLFGDPMPMPVGQKPANRLGLYDFWGNVAEWVMDDTEYVRGGSYLTSRDELTLDWRENESQDIWNETYPNSPKSRWWYRDRYDMGFRLVCDPVNLPEGK